jgi:hypothetical protein
MNETDKETPTEENTLPSAPASRRWVTLLLCMLIFGSGCIVGIGGAVLFIRNQLMQAVHNPQEAPARVAIFLKRRLDLNEEQQTNIEDILRERQKSLMTIRAEIQPRIEEQLDLAQASIAAVLEDSKRETFLKRMKHLRETWTPPMPE